MKTHTARNIMSVYLIGESRDGLHKIGVSGCAWSRLKQIRRKEGYGPHLLSVIHTIAARDRIWSDYWLEAYLHIAFKDARVRGEWFSLNQVSIGVLLEMAEVRSPDDLPAAIVRGFEAHVTGKERCKLELERLSKIYLPRICRILHEKERCDDVERYLKLDGEYMKLSDEYRAAERAANALRQ
jgi:hypothetical protein